MKKDTGRAAAIKKLALRETDAAHYAEFLPITRGPLFAITALFLLGSAAVFFKIIEKLEATITKPAGRL